MDYGDVAESEIEEQLDRELVEEIEAEIARAEEEAAAAAYRDQGRILNGEVTYDGVFVEVENYGFV